MSTQSLESLRRVAVIALCMLCAPVLAQPRVNVDNFKRAETDNYFSKFVKDNGNLGSFRHSREAASIDKQDVIRMNRDTLYSSAVVDLDASPAAVTLPNAGKRYMAMQVINQDHYTIGVIYQPGVHRFTREQVGTRYVLLLVRTFFDPADEADLKTVHALQDRLKIEQSRSGAFEVPGWDTESLDKMRNTLNAVATANGGLDSARMFGSRKQVDPVQHLLGTAAGWGGNPASAALYAGFVPKRNDGKTVHRLTVKNVPVDGFWSISVYNKDGFFEKNARNVYSLNNVSAKTSADGSVTVQFGGCDDKTVNCIPTAPGWSYLARLYRPRAQVINGSWKFPEAQPVD
jgi:hypothetical protein